MRRSRNWVGPVNGLSDMLPEPSKPIRHRVLRNHVVAALGSLRLVSERGLGMSRLIVHRDGYDSVALEGWISRRRHALELPAASLEFLRLLKRKRRGRSKRTRRFFGEAFVASRSPHREAH